MVSTLLSRLFSKKNLLAIFIGVLALAALLVSYSQVFERYELQTYDWRCKIRGPRITSKSIVFVDIADDSLERIGSWPFDREYHAGLIEALRVAGAKAVVFDILFTESTASDEEVARQALKANNVYFATAFEAPVSHRNKLISDKILTSLVPAYEKAAKAVGFVNAQADIDGTRRRIPPMIFMKDSPFYQISLRVAMDAKDIPVEKVRWNAKGYIEFGEDKIPLDEDGYMIVSYAGKWVDTFKHYSYADVVTSIAEAAENRPTTIDLGLLKDKICFVGFTATATHDANANPLEAIYPNVGIHANVLNTILNKDYITRLDRATNTSILLLLGLLVVWICSKNKPLRALSLAIGSLFTFMALAVLVFIWKGLWVDLFYPMAISVMTYVGVTLSRALLEIRKREIMENELKIASQIQKSFLPETLPKEPGISLAVYMKPAKQIGGDLYSFIKLADEKMGVMVGDVSGKGTPAALFMAKIVSEFKFSARQKLDPAQVLTDLNNAIAAESTGGLFVTLSYAIFDREGGRMLLSNGGHLPVVWVGKDAQSELLNPDEGMPIGVMEGVTFAVLEKKIEDGDLYAFYSDGVSEARNIKKQEYGVERLQKLMQEYRADECEVALNKIIVDLNHFMGKADQHDDITLIIVKVDPKIGK